MEAVKVVDDLYEKHKTLVNAYNNLIQKYNTDIKEVVQKYNELRDAYKQQIEEDPSEAWKKLLNKPNDDETEKS